MFLIIDIFKFLYYNIIKGVENMNNCIFIMLMQVNKMLRESKTEELSIFEGVLLFITIIFFTYTIIKITFF